MESHRQERELRLELTRADTALKREQKRWEPWKAMATAFSAGIAFATTALGLTTWALTRFLPH